MAPAGAARRNAKESPSLLSAEERRAVFLLAGALPEQVLAVATHETFPQGAAAAAAADLTTAVGRAYERGVRGAARRAESFRKRLKRHNAGVAFELVTAAARGGGGAVRAASVVRPARVVLSRRAASPRI